MNKNRFIELVSLTSSVTQADVKELEDLVKNFPYCQAAHILIAKASHDAGSMLADQHLRKAAAYTIDRKNLKNIILKKSDGGIQQEITTTPPETPTPSLEQPAIISEPLKTELPVSKEPVDKIDTPETPKKEVEEKKTDFRDELIRNLEKLREAKRKAAETGEVREKEKEKEKENNNPPPVQEIKKEDSAIISIPSSTSEDVLLEGLKEKTEGLNQPEKQENLTLLVSDLEDEPFIPQVLVTSRLEEVYTNQDQEEKTISRPDHELLIEYLAFLENKRSKLNKKLVTEIIEKFIKEDPSIPYMDTRKLPEEQEDLTKDLSVKEFTPVSENFANILEKQGKFEKAIDLFKKLSLKNPEKKAYFAGRIEILEQKLRNNNLTDLDV